MIYGAKQDTSTSGHQGTTYAGASTPPEAVPRLLKCHPTADVFTVAGTCRVISKEMGPVGSNPPFTEVPNDDLWGQCDKRQS